MKLSNIQKENIIEKIMNSRIRCISCSSYDRNKEYCNADKYEGRTYAYCFGEIFKYIESNNLWEEMIKKHRIKDF